MIPSKLRRKFGIKKGTQVYVYERDGEVAIKPITDVELVTGDKEFKQVDVT